MKHENRVLEEYPEIRRITRGSRVKYRQSKLCRHFSFCFVHLRNKVMKTQPSEKMYTFYEQYLKR